MTSASYLPSKHFLPGGIDFLPFPADNGCVVSIPLLPLCPEVVMLTRRFAVVLSFAVLLAVSAAISCSLLFADVFGNLCWPGDWVKNPPVVTQNPPKNTNPPSFIETTFEKTEHTDGACEINATCIPPCVTCETERSYVILGIVDGFRVIEQTFKQEFVRNAVGEYNPRDRYFYSGALYGWYIMCTDSLRDGWE